VNLAQVLTIIDLRSIARGLTPGLHLGLTPRLVNVAQLLTIIDLRSIAHV